MKIFISWSGERSQKIAELFKDWIQCVIQAAKPWISSHDVDRGALWYTEISKTLADSQFGILCLTPVPICSLLLLAAILQKLKITHFMGALHFVLLH